MGCPSHLRSWRLHAHPIQGGGAIPTVTKKVEVICHLSFALRLAVEAIVGMALRADASHKGQRGPTEERKTTWNVAAAYPHLTAARVAGVGPPS